MFMKKAIFVLILTVSMAGLATAQSDYKKGEFFIGYSAGRFETAGAGPATQAQTGVSDNQWLHGANVSGVYNLSRYFGIKADVSGTYNKTKFSFPVTTGASTQTVSFDRRHSLYNFLGGVQIKDNNDDKKLKPFVHGLVGVAHVRNKVSNTVCTTTNQINCGQIGSFNENGLAFAFGGGLDVRVNDRIDFRAFQIDYNPITFDESTTNNFRLGIGIVIK